MERLDFQSLYAEKSENTDFLESWNALFSTTT